MKSLVLAVFITCLLISSAYADLTAYFIDVGQGDAEYIELPNGKKVLIDGGPSSSTSGNLADFITTHNITQIDYVVLTHPHSDHYQGLNYVFDNCQVNNFYDTKMNNSGAAGDETIRNKVANEPNCTIVYPSANDTLNWDSDITVKVFNACPNDTSNSNGETINNSSIVLKMTYAGKSLLFTGDIQSSKETDLVSTYGDDLQASYLKVAHHGSAYSSSAAFLDKVKPEKVFIEVGANNSYGHPDAGTITRLQNAGATVYRTDTDGTLTYTITTSSPTTYYIKGYVKDSQGSAISGVTVSLSGTASKTYTTITDGYYEFTNLSSGNYTVTPTKTNYSFTPNNKSYTTLSNNRDNQDFTGTYTTITYYIKGYVKDSNGNGISNVTLNLSETTSGSYLTGINGYYEFINLASGDYVITPTKTNYTFTSTSRSYTPLNSNQDNQNFTGTYSLPTYSIKGYVKDSSDNPVIGASLTLSGDSSQTYLSTSSGSYEFLNLDDGTYTITPSQDNYYFDPSRRTYSNLNANYENQNFTRLPGLGLITTYFIRGYVLDSSAVGAGGVMVNLSGDSTEAYLTNSTGYYEFINLQENKNYIITPSKTDARFTPASRNYNSLSANQDSQNFTLLVSGKVNIVGGEKGYINPAKGEKAKILITPTESGTVMIKLYDLVGNKVWEKIEAVTGNQTKTIFWDVKNEGGSTVSSGIYLLQIEGAGIKEKKKIAVVK